MRISDWSSDVCSSDLWIAHRAGAPGGKAGEGELDVARSKIKCRGVEPAAHVADVPVRSHADFDVGDLLGAEELLLGESRPQGRGADAATAVAARSEEHTSELQSLMRNSYAVFCLTKKT